MKGNSKRNYFFKDGVQSGAQSSQVQDKIRSLVNDSLVSLLQAWHDASDPPSI